MFTCCCCSNFCNFTPSREVESSPPTQQKMTCYSAHTNPIPISALRVKHLASYQITPALTSSELNPQVVSSNLSSSIDHPNVRTNAFQSPRIQALKTPSHFHLQEVNLCETPQLPTAASYDDEDECEYPDEFSPQPMHANLLEKSRFDPLVEAPNLDKPILENVKYSKNTIFYFIQNEFKKLSNTPGAFKQKK